MTNIAKKLFALGSAVTLALSFLTPLTAQAAVHAVGTNVNNNGTVGMIMPGNCVSWYTSAGAFTSYGFNSWSSVVTASAEDLALPTCSSNFIPPQDGQIIVSDRGADKNTAYFISGGQKRGFVSRAVYDGQGFPASRLVGSASVRADVSWMASGANIDTASAPHLPGALVNKDGTILLVVGSGLLGIPDLATFGSWGYSFANTVTANAADRSMAMSGVMAMRQAGQLSPTALAGCTSNCGGPVGPISASLSASNPASGTIVSGQATANLLAFNLTGSGTVNSITLHRSGISDQNTLSNVYLYDGATRLTDGYSFNSAGDLTMGSLGLAVNGSRTISVLADVAGSLTSGTIAVGLTSLTAAGSTASTVNVMGNTMSIVGGSSLASASFSANSLVGATPTVNAGLSSYVFWSAPLQINTRTLQLKAANFRMIGSAPTDALANIKMFVDGVDSGTPGVITTANGSNYVSFNFMGAPKSLQTGSHTVDLRADIQKGSSRTVQFSIQNASDLMIFDPQVGVNLAVGGTIPNVGANVTIGTGSITAVLDPSFTPLTNVTGGASNVNIAKYKLHAYGEDVKVQSLQVLPVMTFPSTTYTSGTVTVGSQSITVGSTTGFAVGNVITIAGATQAVGTITSITSGTVFVVNITTGGVTPSGAVTIQGANGGLQNVTLYFNGSQVGSQQNWTSGNLTFNLGSQLIVPAGTDGTLEVKADIRTTAGANYTGGTVGANMVGGSSNATGQNSQNTLSTPALSGNVLTIQTGLLAVSKNTGYASQSASPNTAGVKIGSFVLQNQSSSESVRVTNVTVNVAYTTAGSTNLAGLRLSETSGSGSVPQQPASVTAPGNANNSFSVDFVLAPGQTKTLDVLADTGSATSGTVITTLTVNSIGVTSNVASSTGSGAGQTMTLGTGTVATPTVLTASSTVAQYIPAGMGGATAGSQATFNFVSTGGSSTISELTFTLNGTANAVTSITVGGITAPVVGTTAYVTGLALVVPNGGSGLNVPVTLNYSEVGTNGIAPGSTATLRLTTVKASSGGTTQNLTGLTVDAPQMTLVGSVPIVTVSSTQQTGLNISGVTKIGEVTIAANAKGNIKVNTIVFTVSSSGFSTAPTAIGSPVISATNNSSNAVVGAVCTPASLVVTCTLDTNANPATGFDGFTVTPGTPVTLSLFGTLTGAAAVGSGTPTITSSIGASTFNWDDTSTNGGAGSVNLSGSLIYQFPNNSFSIKQ